MSTDRLTSWMQFLEERCVSAALDGTLRLCHLISSPRRGGGLRWGGIERRSSHRHPHLNPPPSRGR